MTLTQGYISCPAITPRRRADGTPRAAFLFSNRKKSRIPCHKGTARFTRTSPPPAGTLPVFSMEYPILPFRHNAIFRAKPRINRTCLYNPKSPVLRAQQAMPELFSIGEMRLSGILPASVRILLLNTPRHSPLRLRPGGKHAASPRSLMTDLG